MRATVRRLLLAILLGLSCVGCSSLSYLYQAGRGQLSLYSHEQSLVDAMKDDRIPEKLKTQLRWVPEIKNYVQEKLGVPATKNYTTFVNLKRPYVVWVLSSAPKYKLELKYWSFPIVGSFPYLGFFSEELAQIFAKKEEEIGNETDVRGAEAYSTLGFLRDPLLSSMLKGKKQRLVNIMFHETTHAHAYVKGKGAFNEQIASFFGDYGEKLFLEETFGSRSQEVVEWEKDREDRRHMGFLLRVFYQELKSLYAGLSYKTESEKTVQKKAAFEKFWKKIRSQKWKQPLIAEWLCKKVVNNAALLAMMTYEDEQGLYDTLQEKSSGNLHRAFSLVLEFIRQRGAVLEKEEVSVQREFEDFLK